MKKLLMALAFAGVALGANAQDADPALKYSVATNSFWSNWFVQGNLAGSALWGNQVMISQRVHLRDSATTLASL